MATTKRIICLANSRKPSGRCVAGKELCGEDVGGWIRPVSGRDGEEVAADERQYKDGIDPRVLDIIDVPLIRPRPRKYQQENWLLDPETYWVRRGRIGYKDLSHINDQPDSLWINGFSTYHGLNDRMPLSQAERLTSSLQLIHVAKLTLRVHRPSEAFGNRRQRVQARFRYAEDNYWLRVTDPTFEDRYIGQPDGDYEIGSAFLTVSLGTPYNNDCYKLVAAIIEPGDSDE